MRPSALDPLFAPATSLDGIGDKIAGLISRLVPADLTNRPVRVGDLPFILPHSVIDRSRRIRIAEATESGIVTLTLTVGAHYPPPRGKNNLPYRVMAFDETGEIALTFFHGRQVWLEKALGEGSRVLVSGRIEWFNGRASMVHPDHIVAEAEAEKLPVIEPVYPLTAGLSAKVLRKGIAQALNRFPKLPEWQDAALQQRMELPPIGTALQRIHAPVSPAELSPEGAPWRRLAYDELLAGQLSLALVRQKSRRLDGRPLLGDGRLVQGLLNALPYRLTGSQETALAEIHADMAEGERMLRLLQGDVGSGKTVVALMAMARAVEAGGQAALMAPTEILARQHHATIARLGEAVGLRVGLLTGRDKGRDRQKVLDELSAGEIDILVGTHALFQEGVNFSDLALAIIDEQHRFGVHQRLAITSKGNAPDMLVMTATPIPRTLVLSAFGDMDVSRLTEKPAGRQPIKTVTMPMERLSELVGRMRDAVADGQKVYWICPLVEESENIDVTSAEDRYESLRQVFADQVALVHGRMSGRDKDAAMSAFKNGEARVLVGTTVVEVGVDVPDATIIVIEHAERFGLAQLHQLRGRVGRGEKASSCVLLYKGPLGEVATRRLAVMRETEDGFVIAEEDLKLRGEGDLLGTRQSGSPGFHIARLEFHGDLLAVARDDARLALTRDPELQSDRGEALRVLLYLFGRDDAVRLLRAG
ncbi:ATP-dependent DNA helicase RecG [Nitratireductor basaltis]|uniref:ATP-dependent DNA helicase RecG n=1 Tax=Nitratireductor basaltis TaxID=472175 RepID=A0A084UAP2_9HYPH|nr:ATP-dependent DNA helicase RecG [Nitratireductor basaltis]KFB10028.1 ATP-dependent DNA helicase RecG [Nitratireductor basaltis]